MEIRLYSNESLPNKINKTLTGEKIVQGNFKGEYTEEFPVIEIIADKTAANISVLKQNYLIIKNASRSSKDSSIDMCYFIRSAEFTTNNTVDLSLALDYISTYKSEISKTSFLSNRLLINDQSFKRSVETDPAQPIPPTRSTQIISMGKIQDDSFTSSEGARVMLTTLVKPDKPLIHANYDQVLMSDVGHEVYWLTPLQANRFSISLWETTFSEWFLKMFGKPYDGVQSYMMFPFTPKLPGYQLHERNIRIGDQNASLGTVGTDVAKGYQLDPGPAYGIFQSLDVDIPYDESLGFMNYPPYTKYQLYIPYYGYYNLSPEFFGNPSGGKFGRKIRIDYIISMLTGEAKIQIVSGGTSGFVVDEFPVNLAYNLPFTRESYGGVLGTLAKTAAIGAVAYAGGAAVAAAGAGTVTVGAAGAAAGSGAKSAIEMGTSSSANTAENLKKAADIGTGILDTTDALSGDQFSYAEGDRGRVGGYTPGFGFTYPTDHVNMSVEASLQITKPSNVKDVGKPFIGYKDTRAIHQVGMTGSLIFPLGSYIQISGAVIGTGYGIDGGIFSTRYSEEILTIMKAGVYS